MRNINLVNFKYIFINRSSRKWIWICLFALFLSLFLVVSFEVREAKTGQRELIGDLDRIQIEMLSSVRTPKLNGIAVDLTALGSASILTVLVLLLLIFQRKYIQMCHLVFAALGSAQTRFSYSTCQC